MPSKNATDTVSVNNMLLWNMVKTTDPKMQKPVAFGKRKFTAVDPQWQMEVATKLWGPYGRHWGLFDLKWSTFLVEDISRDGTYTATALALEAMFRYPLDDEKVEFPIINDDKFKVGDDNFKKLITNTRSKALSWLGFSADVFMGKFDDVSYVRDLQARFSDQDALVQKVLVAVRSAKDIETVVKCRDRLHKMIADKTIDDSLVASELLAEVSEREQSLLSE